MLYFDVVVWLECVRCELFFYLVGSNGLGCGKMVKLEIFELYRCMGKVCYFI